MAYPSIRMDSPETGVKRSKMELRGNQLPYAVMYLDEPTLAVAAAELNNAALVRGTLPSFSEF